MKRSRSPSEDKVDNNPSRQFKTEVVVDDTTANKTSSSQHHVSAELQELYQIAMGTSTSSARFPTYPFTVTPSTIDAALESLQQFEKKGTAQAGNLGIKSEVKTKSIALNNNGGDDAPQQQQRRYLFTHGLPRAQFVIGDDKIREEIAAVTGEFMRRRFLQLYNEVTTTNK
jgi:hypothetical protein